MKSEFSLAFNEILEEKGLPPEVIVDAIKSAMVSAYRRAVNASSAQHIEAEIDLQTGIVKIFAEKEVVDSVQDERTEVSLSQAIKVNPEIQIGDMLIVESTPKNFGRVAAQTARQVIQQRIREAERESQYNHFITMVGEIISGVIQAINVQHITLGLENKAEGIMPRSQQIPREHFRVHDRVRALLLEVKTSPRGPQIILSRAHNDFLRRLLENEVPEIYHGLIEIRSISREPGQRSKVAVTALQPGVDPVGACVGIRGVRIQTIVRELNDEKIDVIEWDSNPSVFIGRALSPARVKGVYLHESNNGPKTATVVVPEDQLSLAIGRDGQNVRLAAKLTTWRIDIKSLPEAASETLYKIQNNPEYKLFALEEKDVIAQVEASLAKKAEGRPVTPEEYQIMSHFIDRIEQEIYQKKSAERIKQEEAIKQARESIPNSAFELPLNSLGISNRAQNLLINYGYKNVGDLMLQLNIDSDKILAINGFGPKAMEEVNSAIDALVLPEKQEETIESEIAREQEQISEDLEKQEKLSEEITESISQVKEEEETSLPEKPETEQLEETIEETSPITTQTEEPTPIDSEEISDLFKLKPEMLDIEELEFDVEDFEHDDLETDKEKPKKKKKKKSKKYLEVEYDPDHDITIYKRKRKHDTNEWDDTW